MIVHRFADFELHLGSGRLFRDNVRVPLSEPQTAILVLLVTHAGEVVPKNVLVEAGWRTEAVSDATLATTISRLRKVLDAHGRSAVIETVRWRGYRFAAPVQRAERHDSGGAPHTELEPYRAFVQGRADLHSLNREKIGRARAAFDEALRREPDYVPAHIGLASACALAFEASRIDAVCDIGALADAVHHARRATALAPGSGDAWSALAFARYLQGDVRESSAAALKATALEPDNWLHALRLAFVSWGEERVRAARTVLALCPGLALAHWLMATVLVARGAFDAALEVLRAGCAEQDAQDRTSGAFPAVGLHLLRGLVLAARGNLDDAADAFMRELLFANSGQIYARECAANTWYALAAIRRRQGRIADGEAAFRRALQVAPAHLPTLAAVGHPLPVLADDDPRGLDLRLADAAGLARSGRHEAAARTCHAAIVDSPVPCAGWILPVEPLIDAGARPDVWSDVLARIRSRAV